MSKETSKKVASKASAVLRNPSTAPKSKAAAGSALSQTNAPRKETSAAAAKKASAALRDGRSGAATKAAAGSALSQKRRGK